MLPEALDFRAESDALASLLEGAGDEQFASPTLFKSWTVDDVIGHLHLWNHAALLTLQDPEAFQRLLARIVARLTGGATHPELQKEWLDGQRGRALYETWRELYPRLAERYRNTDPDRRVRWAGPEMSARSSIAARQMETWAHGQEVFDLLGIERVDTDRLRNIAHIGVKTYSWSFLNRGDAVPKPKPHVRLTAPSGALWEWNDPQAGNSITGRATEFCQVVTQTRNIADTALQVVGPAATRWMAIAQCFAGLPEDPPAAGTRYIAPAVS